LNKISLSDDSTGYNRIFSIDRKYSYLYEYLQKLDPTLFNNSKMETESWTEKNNNLKAIFYYELQDENHRKKWYDKIKTLEQDCFDSYDQFYQKYIFRVPLGTLDDFTNMIKSKKHINDLFSLLRSLEFANIGDNFEDLWSILNSNNNKKDSLYIEEVDVMLRNNLGTYIQED
jgi:hypothetical protein